MIKGTAILVALSALAAVATHLWHPAAPVWYLAQVEAGVNEVTMQDIQARWKNDVLWVDARTQERYDQEHVPGALLINEFNRDNALFDNLEKLQTSGKPIIIYCDGQKCEASHKMREYLAESAGLPDVWVLTGGWPAWKQSTAH